MENRFTFKRGVWEDGSPLPEWQDGHDTDQYAHANGYSSSSRLGNEFGSEIELYESENGSFLAIVTPLGGLVYEVFIPDFPSFMMFVRDHATAFAVETTTSQQQEMLSIMQKLFYLQHGHTPDRICPSCDPVEWDARSRRQKAAGG